MQPKAKSLLQDSYLAEGKEAAGKSFDLFVATLAAKYPKASGCLAKDREPLRTFSD